MGKTTQWGPRPNNLARANNFFPANPERTRDAFAAAKARGVELGGFRGRAGMAEDCAAASPAKVAKAKARAADWFCHANDRRRLNSAGPRRPGHRGQEIEGVLDEPHSALAVGGRLGVREARHPASSTVIDGLAVMRGPGESLPSGADDKSRSKAPGRPRRAQKGQSLSGRPPAAATISATAASSLLARRRRRRI